MTLLSVEQAREVIREEVEKRQDTIFLAEVPRPITEETKERLADILARGFLADIFTPPREPGKPQYRASLRRINARFNVRTTGEVTKAYLLRQMDRFEGSQGRVREAS